MVVHMSNMIKRPKVMTVDDVIHELDGDDYFLDKLDYSQESVILGSDNEFSDLEICYRDICYIVIYMLYI